MRFRLTILLCATLIASGCSTLRILTGRCETEWIDLRWVNTIERSGFSATTVLAERIFPTNLGRENYEKVRDVVVHGAGVVGTGLMWSASAFNVNGGYINVLMPLPVTADQVIPVDGAFEGGGWEIRPLRPGASASVAVRATDFVATSASGSIRVTSVAPLAVHLDITVTSSSGERMHIVGDPQFSLRNESVVCD